MGEDQQNKGTRLLAIRVRYWTLEMTDIAFAASEFHNYIDENELTIARRLNSTKTTSSLCSPQR